MVRQSKIIRGLGVLDGTHVQMDGLACMEIEGVRHIFTGVFDQIGRLEAVPALNEFNDNNLGNAALSQYEQDDFQL